MKYLLFLVCLRSQKINSKAFERNFWTFFEGFSSKLFHQRLELVCRKNKDTFFCFVFFYCGCLSQRKCARISIRNSKESLPLCHLLRNSIFCIPFRMSLVKKIKFSLISLMVSCSHIVIHYPLQCFVIDAIRHNRLD